MTPFIVPLLVKVTLLLALGLIASASLRRLGPSFRHQVLLVTVGSCLLLPVFLALTPRWDVGVLPAVALPDVASNAPGSPAVGSDTRLSAQTAQPSVFAANRSNTTAAW